MNRDPLSCPHCGNLNDRHTPVFGEKNMQLGDGDFSLCLTCGKWGIFEQGGFRLPTMVEWATILHSPDCRQAEWAWQQMRRQMKMN